MEGMKSSRFYVIIIMEKSKFKKLNDCANFFHFGVLSFHFEYRSIE